MQFSKLMMGLFQYSRKLCFCILLVLNTCAAGSYHSGHLYPGFEASIKEWINNNNGLFLLSNNSVFGLGFYRALSQAQFLLVVIHISSGKVVWTANRPKLVEDSAKFVFDNNGSVSLKIGNEVAWSPDTSTKKVASLELWDKGNLVLLGSSGGVLWQSFGHPTDTLLPGQEFLEGMRLESRESKDNLKVYLEFKLGDLVLYAGYQTPQTYWSLSNDSRTNNSVGGRIHSAILESNAWNFYDHKKALLLQFVISKHTDQNATLAAILGSDGAIRFYNLQKANEVTPEAVKIPQNSCSSPEPCGPFYVCYFENQCQCPPSLSSQFNCKPPVSSTCNSSTNSAKLLNVGTNLDYFALSFVTPLSSYNLGACKEACLRNCSCLVLFFQNHSGNCFLFDWMGGFQRSQGVSNGYVSYMKVSSGNGRLNRRSEESRKRVKHIPLIVLIIVSTVLVIAAIFYVGIWYICRKGRSEESSLETLELDNFSNNFSAMPIRFGYDDLCKATKNFSIRIGHGGFGPVYLGILPDGSQVAVKKLESIGQGKKEFKAEVSIFGNVHHFHLVKLRGFCAEGAHRLLVYEYMVNGSLDKWIFNINEESQFLSWNTRFNIALGMAKGLAYLHEECEVKIVHCDIKPQNVLLDQNFTAKVSDFGLAKLMNREESLVYTKVRGTRGYLAPEWITNNPISEKTDVYSYGVVLLEIIAGRKAYELGDDSQSIHFPSYAFKMLEEAKIVEILDPKLDMNGNDESVITAIKVALWCIQNEMHLRPSMTKVVQMLEGLCEVPQPPMPSHLSSQVYSSNANWSSEEDTTLGPVSGGLLSNVQLSGPR